ncbi:MAG: ShlB/FhaC/HecB family hemolysin secretion/activation protein [Alphaproteobacteria bacterium]|nr:ShlB/FhaC/HecB family hemolysin secretion/activation protein [Alphaproteobacteria bacterium]
MTALAAALVAMPAMAQSIQVPSAGDISRQRVAPPPLQAPNFDLRIQNPERSAVPRAVDEIEFQVSSVEVLGAAHYPKAEVDAVFAPLVGRMIVLEDLRQAAQKLEDRYKADGFFLSRVFVPPQQVKDGVLQVQVVEGRISAVFVEAPDAATRRRIEKAMAPLLEMTPLKLSALESRMLILNDIPGLRGTSLLRPGAELGETEMVVTAEKKEDNGRFSVSNTSSSLIGPWTYAASGTLNRPFGRTGALDLGVAAGGQDLGEITSGNVRYAEPIGHRGLIFSLGGVLGFAHPGGTVRALDVRSRIISVAARLRYPLLQGRENSVFLDTAINLNRSRTRALGTRITDDKTTVAEATLSWQQNGWANGATTLSASLFRGLGLFDALDAGDPLPSTADFKPRFTRLSLSALRLQGLTQTLSAVIQMQAQLTDDTLLSGEQISFGGPAIGRGYDPSLIAGDRGIGGLVELRYDTPLEIPNVTKAVQFYVFADAAAATTLTTPSAPKSTDRLSSIGIGLRTTLFGKMPLDLQFADARRTIAGDTGRDPRVTMSLGLVF